jgi:hypothetical protein
MKKVILLTDARSGEKVLIGVDSIIRAEKTVLRPNADRLECTEIASRHAMVCTTYVTETPEEIHALSK